MSHPAQRPNTARTLLLIGVGMVLFVLLLAATDPGADDPGYPGYDDSGSGGGGTSFYDSGSISTTEDGELIYSDTDGGSFSSGG
ncbi:hypothetical protein [Pseudonocardia lacus]|uniref:hypothetical protein n=1 Tax=Pseudonocardia lacus TaxID=2835865 RepID=UPI001BDDB2BB|nr:hypothetical protein [Pseudonocardia lacus]